jgi:hypothetical protein
VLVVADPADPGPTDRDPRPPRVTVPSSLPWRLAVRTGLRLPLGPARSVTSASISSAMTSRPIATEAASSPSRRCSANRARCPSKRPASRSASPAWPCRPAVAGRDQPRSRRPQQACGSLASGVLLLGVRGPRSVPCSRSGGGPHLKSHEPWDKPHNPQQQDKILDGRVVLWTCIPVRSTAVLPGG